MAGLLLPPAARAVRIPSTPAMLLLLLAAVAGPIQAHPLGVRVIHKFSPDEGGISTLSSNDSAQAYPFPAGFTGDERPKWASTFKYQGGPIVTAPLNVFNIFLGNWESLDDQCAPQVLQDLVNSISDSTPHVGPPKGVPSVYDWWRTVHKYTDKNKQQATDDVAVTGTWRLPLTPDLPTSFNTEQDIVTVVMAALKKYTNMAQPPDNALFGIFLAENVPPLGSFCGFHTQVANREAPGKPISIAFFPHPKTGLGYCGDLIALSVSRHDDTMQGNVSATDGKPFTSNGCLTADTLADTVMHEIAEHVTDPSGKKPAWLCSSKDSKGEQANCENQDICNVMTSIPRPPGEPTLKTWVKDSPEYVAFKNAKKSKITKGWYNLKGINGRTFYVSGALDPVTKICVMSG